MCRGLQQLLLPNAQLSVPDLLFEIHVLLENDTNNRITPEAEKLPEGERAQFIKSESNQLKKKVLQALNLLFALRAKFDAGAYGIVIQRLVDLPPPLPFFCIRTITQVVKDIPSTRDFIVSEVLPSLIQNHKVHEHAQHWKGMLLILDHTFKTCRSAPRVVLMLPVTKIEDIRVEKCGQRGT